MRGVHVKTIEEADGELRLANVPVRKGDPVEAILLVPDDMTEERRGRARADFIEHMRPAAFRSAGPYPSREYLHERRGQSNLSDGIIGRIPVLPP